MGQDELTELYKVYYSKTVKYPHKMRIDKPRKGVLYTEFTVDDRKAVKRRITDLENAKKHIFKCFLCDKYFKEDKGGRWMPMDKRESGDGLFGHAFACWKCVPREYGRL
jgi:hypothetical protein